MSTTTFLSILLLSVLNHGATGQYEYATACIPTHYIGSPNSSGCTMYIHCGPEPANIDITTIDGTQSLSLKPGETQKIVFDNTMFPVFEIESKAIRVEADADVQVLLYKRTLASSASQFKDVYQVPRLSPSATQFVTSGFDASYHCSSSNYVNQFYLITTFYDDTTVQVTRQDGTSFEVVLPSFGTYVDVAVNWDDLIASGTQITSDKAITVVSGNLCDRNGDESTSSTALSNMAPTSNLAQHYLIPHMIARSTDSPGYSLHVVASEDNTMVQLEDGTEVELPSVGNSSTFEFPDKREWMSLYCSKPCLAALYSKAEYHRMGFFMLPMIAPQDFYSSAFFITTDMTYDILAYLSLVVEGEDPGTDILLNGNSLDYLDWGSLDGYATAQTSLAEGSYRLESVTGRSFAAYVYVHDEYANGGIGYALVPIYNDPSTVSSRLSAPGA